MAESFRLRMRWLETFSQGRIANAAVRKVGDLASLTRKTVALSEKDKSSLLFLKHRVFELSAVMR